MHQPIVEETLLKLGISSLNTMQQQVLEASASQKNILLLSPTGSGKTLGFLLPALLRLKPDVKDIQLVIISPTRELALQIQNVFKNMKTGYKISCCYGGHDITAEENSLAETPTVLVGTPGRITDHINRKNIDLKNTASLVLDEFDKCLEMGFQDDMYFIIQHLKSLKNRILVSATEAVKIPDFVAMQGAYVVNFISNKNNLLEIKYYRTPSDDKLEALYQLCKYIGHEQAIVFCNQREAVDEVSQYLSSKKVFAKAFHGGMEQHYRESALTRFRNKSTSILVTTDLGARGLDIPSVKYVIHFQLPPKEDAFVHRNGRTARMKSNGTAILLLSKNDYFPDFLSNRPQELLLDIPDTAIFIPEWETIYIGGGKKDKINKVDIVGFLIQKGKLQKHELGLIEIKDECSYVAISRTKVKSVLDSVKNEKIKNKKVKIAIAREAPLQ